METTPVDAATAAAIEAAEARAWEDVYAAAPRGWATQVGLGTHRVGETLVMHWAATGRRYFSRAIGLGVTAPAEAGRRRLLALWERLGISMFLVQSMPHCLPAGYTDWLRERGLQPFDQQDRIVRAEAAATTDTRSGRSASSDRSSASGPRPRTNGRGFLQRVYRLNTGPWLPQLARPSRLAPVRGPRARRGRGRPWHAHRPQTASPGWAWMALCPGS